MPSYETKVALRPKGLTLLLADLDNERNRELVHSMLAAMVSHNFLPAETTVIAGQAGQPVGLILIAIPPVSGVTIVEVVRVIFQQCRSRFDILLDSSDMSDEEYTSTAGVLFNISAGHHRR